jgi:hypothetical protein
MNWRHIVRLVAHIARVVARVADKIHDAHVTADAVKGSFLADTVAQAAHDEASHGPGAHDGAAAIGVENRPPSPGPLTDRLESPFTYAIFDAQDNRIGGISGAAFAFTVWDDRAPGTRAVGTFSTYNAAWAFAQSYFTK